MKTSFAPVLIQMKCQLTYPEKATMQMLTAALIHNHSKLEKIHYSSIGEKIKKKYSNLWHHLPYKGILLSSKRA